MKNSKNGAVPMFPNEDILLVETRDADLMFRSSLGEGNMFLLSKKEVLEGDSPFQAYGIEH